MVLPSARLFPSQFEFYLHVSELFKAVSNTQYDVSFTQLALSVASPGLDTSSLWHNVIKGLTDLAQYEDAYTALVSNPYERLCVSDGATACWFVLMLSLLGRGTRSVS